MTDKLSTLASLSLRLADWIPAGERYQRRYLPVDFHSERESGNRNVLAAVPQFRPFSVRSWVGGEGVTWWEPDTFQYRESSNVRPVRIRDGLELCALPSVTTQAAGSFNAGQQFGLGLGKLYTANTTSPNPIQVIPWDVTVPDWDTGVSTTLAASANDYITSFADIGDALMYAAMWNKGAGGVILIQGGGGGAGGAHYYQAADFFHGPVIRAFDGVLYALDDDDLYVITGENARTPVADLADWTSDDYLDQVPWSFNRMSVSDKGPIWITRTDNGQTFLWEYDVNDDVQRKLGKLPVDFAFPYSIYFTKGFTFVGFRYATEHTEAGEAYLWFKRGAQDGVVGPIRAPSATESDPGTASKPVLIAGVIGDDLIFYFDGVIWAYNMSYGGVYQMAKQGTTGTPYGAITFGKDVFIAPVTNASNTRSVERFDTTKFAASGTIDMGKHDWDYPGIDKILLDVTVITDPLPANTRVSLYISVDGDTYVNITSPSQYHQTDDDTKFTWVCSTSGGSTLIGNEFEIRLMLETTDSSVTPTIREVSARAKAAAHLLEIVMQVDAKDLETGDGIQSSEDLIAGLNSLAETPAVYAFTDRFQKLSTTAPPSAIDVTIQDIATPEVEDIGVEEDLSAVIVLHGVDLV